MSEIEIRIASRDDFPDLLKVFTQSVHQIASNSYSVRQLSAWAPDDLDTNAWATKMSRLVTYVAEVDSGPVGFLSVRRPSHLEMLFTDPAHSRRGVATALYKHALQAEWASQRPLTTDASQEARPFFEKQGWRVVRPETVFRNGVSLKRFQMELA